ncbi:MAG: AAA family ATPase [bacterium]|nr:AAA family ATPase [bacterium]
MINVDGYRTEELLHEGRNTLVYRARRNGNDNPVILKVHRNEYPDFKEIEKFKREYEFSHLPSLKGVVKPLALEKYNNGLALIFQDFGGVSLAEVLKSKKVGIQAFLKIAHRVTEALESIHAHDIIHMDIKPHNIIINLKSGEVAITDFGISVRLTRENSSVASGGKLEGTLAYISPEQTGRMNRAIDYRTDFYSLGVTFFQMVTGQLPFDSSDQMEMVHNHIAVQPTPPDQIFEEIPQAVSAIIMKLLSKNAEDRYQSAAGLRFDLEECIRSKGAPEDFVTGKRDVSEKFQIPQKLYGRQKEKENLMEVFDQVLAGDSQMAVVQGTSGIGKSALIHELRRPLVEKRGYFISGKFDQFKRDIPYSSIIQALQEIIRQILTESEEQISKWKDRLQKALGPNGQVIISVIPEVELIIGPQPAVDELSPAEAENRFNVVFTQFVRTFAARKHPLTIFIDDMQWSDGPSLRLLENIITNSDIKYTFVILSYRDTEVDLTHPLSEFFQRLAKVEKKVERFVLEPLAVRSVNELLIDTFHCEPDHSLPLAELLHVKTNGNPFFVAEFLKSLYESRSLNFEQASGNWTWDIENIRSMGITDNVIDLMTDKIQKLGGEVQELLKLASCIGNKFDLHVLSIVYQKTPERTLTDLQEALQEGLLQPTGEETRYQQGGKEAVSDVYRFLHDRVQQAAYGMMDEAKKAEVHLSIGRLLHSSIANESLSEELFNIVNHYNQGLDLIEKEEERTAVAELNLLSGQKAIGSTAYEPASRYLQFGLTLLPDHSWSSNYELTRDLNTTKASAENLCGNYDDSDRYVQVVIENSKNVLDKVPVYDVLIRTRNNQNRLPESVKAAREILKMLGVSLPKKGSFLKVGPALMRAKAIIALKGADSVLAASPMENLKIRAAMQIMKNIGSTLYQTDFWLFGRAVMVMTYLTYRFGHNPVAPYALGLYALATVGVLGDINGGNKFGRLSLKLLERPDTKPLASKTIMLYNSFVRHWKFPLKDTFEDFLKGAQAGLEAGDLEYRGYCYYFQGINRLFSVDTVPNLHKDLGKYYRAQESVKQLLTQYSCQTWWQFCENLLGKSEDKLALQSAEFDGEKILDFFRKNDFKSGLAFTAYAKALLAYLFHEHEQAQIQLDEVATYEQATMGMSQLQHFAMIDSLNRLAVLPKLKGGQRRKSLRRVAKNQRKLKRFAAYAPMNQQHRWDLVEAERARVAGNQSRAMDYYDRAILGARESEHLMEEALGNELAADFYFSIDKEKVARTYLTDARYAYQRWGSPVKVEDLAVRYPQAVAKILAAASGPRMAGGTHETRTATLSTDTASSDGATTASLDVNTVLKAAQTLSGEIFLDKLLSRVMKIVIENAGAQRGVLMLETDGKILIEAEDDINSSEPAVMQSLPINAKNSGVPEAIVRYVHRTVEDVVLGDATSMGRFTNTPYVVEHQPKSVLCTPITKQGKLVGILYLENNLTTNAFTPERVEMLSILSAQAAISIENARLVADETERQKLQKEMEMAKDVQMSILPAESEDNDYNIAAHMTPAEQVGGDYYDYYQVNGDRWIAIGDVTGHGLNSGLLMLMAQTGFSTYLNSTNTPDTVELFKAVNRTLHNNMATRTKQNLYMTFTALRADGDGNFEHVGKHEDILVWRKATGKVEVIPTDGVWMGIVPDVSGMIDKSAFKLNPGDFIILYTDGVIECRDQSRQQFDTERLINVIEENASEGIVVVKDRIVKACFDFMDHQDDDVTLFLMQKK